MSKRMSRRAVLKTIGIAPAILSAASLEARADAQEQAANVVDEFWTPKLLSDLDTVVEKGAPVFRTHHGRNWTPNERTRYRIVGRNLYAFYQAGIKHVSDTQANGRLTVPPRFLVNAWHYKEADSGPKVAMNLLHFTGDHGPVDIETEICAWRCGQRAAEKALEDDQNATEVTLDDYEAAWREIRGDVFALRVKLTGSNPAVPMLRGGGGC